MVSPAGGPTANYSNWDWAAISPENQARIMTGALGTAEEQRRGAELPADIALKQAQTAYALQHAGILPQQMDVERGKNAIAMYQAQVHSRAVAVEEALIDAKRALASSQTAENQAKVDQLTREKNMIDGQLQGLDRVYATLAPKEWVKSKTDVGTGHSAQIAMAKYVADSLYPGDPEGPAKALQWIKRTDENSFIKEMLPKVTIPGSSADRMIKATEDLRQVYRELNTLAAPEKPGGNTKQNLLDKYNQ